MRRQQIFSDDTEIAPGTGRKTAAGSGTETGPFRSPHQSYRMRLSVGTTSFFAPSRSVELSSDAKALKSRARSSSIRRTGKTSVSTVNPTTFFSRAGPASDVCGTIPDLRPLQGETVRMRRVPLSVHVIFTRNDNGLIDHHR